jgi:hypothetical protein
MEKTTPTQETTTLFKAMLYKDDSCADSLASSLNDPPKECDDIARVFISRIDSLFTPLAKGCLLDFREMEQNRRNGICETEHLGNRLQ